jgi:serine kinase of HPr protein (carbohydrate metabolism regulator)
VTGASVLVHGTCVALGAHAVLLRGGSGAGKSDLALRFLSLPPEGLEARLVADDQVAIEARSGRLMASPPASLAGKLEVRGVGIVEMPHLSEANLVLVVDLVEPKNVARMPPEKSEIVSLAGVPLPLLRLAPFEASAPLKLKLALLSATPQLPI